MRDWDRCYVLLGALLAALTLCDAASGGAEPSLHVEFDEGGLQSIAHRGSPVLKSPQGEPVVNWLRFPAQVSDGAPFRQLFGPKPASKLFDQATSTLIQRFDWGRLETEYAVRGNRIDLTVSVTNTSLDQPIIWHEIDLLQLSLPNLKANRDTAVGLAGRVLEHETGVIALVNWEAADAITIEVRSQATTEGRTRSIVLTRLPPRAPKHPIVDGEWFEVPGRPILPGGSDTTRLSLVFGEKGETVEELVPEVSEHIRKHRPQALTWRDRRPIGTLFLANPATGWKTNPRGYRLFKDQEYDVFSDEGLEVFRADLLAYADRSIELLKKMDAQGVIVWDIEGAEFPHYITYIGDPLVLDQISPEMGRYADEFMAKFAAAGLRTGITVRPTEVYRRSADKWDWWHRDVADPVALMSRKIADAQRRWGCSIFYIDSNVFTNAFDTKIIDKSVPYVMPLKMIQRLQELHPDCLLIPEWSTPEYVRFSAPYHSANLRQRGTAPWQRQLWPDAFSAISIDATGIEDNFSAYLSAVQGGDVLLFPAFYAAPENDLVQLIYSASRRTPLDLTRTSKADLVRMLKRDDVLVRLDALLALRHGGYDAAPEVLAELERLLFSKSQLQTLAADALGRMGDAAVPLLVDAVRHPDTRVQRLAIRALGDTSTGDAVAAQALMQHLDVSGPEAIARSEHVIVALGKLRATAAVDQLHKVLSDDDRTTESARRAAIIALGRIGDARSVGPLLAQWDRVYTSVVVYAIPGDLDDALAAISGERLLSGKKQWLDWRELAAP